MKFDKKVDIDKFKLMIGKKVWKRKTHKPFKSKLQVNTIKAIMDEPHPATGYPCFLFEEDDSYVECFRCEIFKEY